MMNRKNLSCMLALTLVLLVGLAPLATLDAQADKRRWKKLDEYIVESMEIWDVQGMAIGVIDHGKVILSQGYGLRNVEENLPVTDETIFAIGSSSKAFTALAVSMLVEDGLIEWDEPIQTYLPDFELWDEIATEEMTAVDLLSHVSGLPRHDLAWYGSTKTRTELYAALKHFEPTTSFRGGWQYQNLMYMTAGVLIQKLMGKTWEQFIQERILDPLGMNATSPLNEALSDNAMASKGYGLEDSVVTLLPYKNIQNIGPAGSINSNVKDMLKWVDMMLHAGKVDTSSIAETGTVRAVMQPRSIMPSGANEDRFYMLYGMGWTITSYRGHLMVEHGGNIDGFSAGVCLFPEDSVGIVILTNMNATPITTVMEHYIADIMFDLGEKDWSAEVREEYNEAMSGVNAETEEDLIKVQGTSPSKDLSDYVGLYTHPGYGDIRIVMGDTTLRVQYNGLDLALGHYHYDVFQFRGEQLGKMKMQFFLDMNGEIEKLDIRLQLGVDPIEFYKQFEAADMEGGILEAYVGQYEIMGATVEVYLEEGELKLSVPNQPTYTLEPVKSDVFNIQDVDGFSVAFSRGEGEAVNAMTFMQPNGNFKAERK